MSAGAWLREEQTDLAVDKILTAAGEAFVALGVDAATMSDIARHAGCSRGTLYRYFKTRRDLHLAYVDRGAREITKLLRSRLAGIVDPRERLIASITGAIAEVRARPDMAAWFQPGQAGFTAELSGRPELARALTASLAEGLVERSGGPDRRLALRWCVRVIVSLLTAPGESEDEERELIARFVVPGVLEAAG